MSQGQTGSYFKVEAESEHVELLGGEIVDNLVCDLHYVDRILLFYTAVSHFVHYHLWTEVQSYRQIK